ncbi:MAG TPA: hypothetical protein VFR18_25615 [Terriglobia bacterium]|nr:hypothetical protein [Terriglobia bacterium]
MRVMIAGALSLLFGGLSFAQDWVNYTSKSDFFAVNFPAQPRVQDITYRTEYNLSLPGHIYSHTNGAHRYSVTVVDYSNAEKLIGDRVKSCQAELGEVDACTPQFQSRTEMRGAIVFATWAFLQRDAKLTHLTYAYADLVEGHQLQLVNKDNSRTFAAIYMHENRLYILEGTVPEGAPPPGLFQQSLQFLDKDGNKVRYQSIYSNGFPAPPKTIYR